MTAPARVDALLAEVIARGLDRLDARLLMSHVLGEPRTWLLTHGEHMPDGERADAFETLAARRLEGEPMAYLLGEQEFHGLVFEVGPPVLVPRPDTELLVDWAIERIAETPHDRPPPMAVVDLGTGSGAIAIAVKHRCPWVAMSAVDVSVDALTVARRNAMCHGANIEMLAGSWWQPLAGRRFDLALANPPYVADGDDHLPALRHEPTIALTSGRDGLDALCAVIADAGAHLWPGAWLLVEHGFAQGAAVRALFADAGFGQVATRRDMQGHERSTGGRCPVRRGGAP